MTGYKSCFKDSEEEEKMIERYLNDSDYKTWTDWLKKKKYECEDLTNVEQPPGGRVGPFDKTHTKLDFSSNIHDHMKILQERYPAAKGRVEQPPNPAESRDSQPDLPRAPSSAHFRATESW